ncbi:MAG: hypothetical protein ACJ74Q_15745 [Pyrinomonadaceae bacterium]
MNGVVYLLDDKNQPVAPYPPHLVELLIEGALSPDAADELDRLHRQRRRLQCGCKRILHVVQGNAPFLRRNPRQVERIGECGLCSSSGSGARSRSLEVPREYASIGVILGTRIHRPQDTEAEGKGEVKSGGTSQSQKYARAFGVLFSLMEKAGLTSLPTRLAWDELWARIHEQLRGARVHQRAGQTFAEFAWMPGRLYAGGLPDLNRRLGRWAHPEVQAEGWAFCVVEESPKNGEVSYYGLPSAARDAIRSRGGELYPPYQFQVPPHNVARIGRTGPYIALAICTMKLSGDQKYCKPTFHRLLLQAIASESVPVPVESSFEREVVFLLQRLRVPFRKPLFSDESQLRPDFVLPERLVVIEVQGMNDEDYRKHKRVIHEKIRMSEKYSGFELITYDPNEGEKLTEFERKLLPYLS